MSVTASIYDLGKQVHGAPHWLNRMTICTQAYPTRSTVRKRRRPRSPRIYVRHKAWSNLSTPPPSKKYRPILLPTLLLAIMSTSHLTTRAIGHTNAPTHFDAFSFPIGVGGRATRLPIGYANILMLFDTGTPPIDVGSCATGGTTNTKTDFPSTVLAPKGSLPFRLLPPQHFTPDEYAQGINKRPRGTLSPTSDLDHIMSWAGNQFAVNAPLTTDSHIAIINSSAGQNEFASLVSLVDAPAEPVALSGHHLIPDLPQLFLQRASHSLYQFART
jgi:hypothetical protein